jgi:CysZ protein
MTRSEQTSSSSSGCSPVTFVGNFLSGTSYPFRAFGLLQFNPSLWGYVAIPVAVNLVVGIVLYTSLLMAGFHGIDMLLADVPEWAHFFAVILQAVLVLLLLIVIGFILLRFGVVLGAPWYGQLSEHLEERFTGRPAVSPPPGWKTIARDIWEALGFEVKKLLLLVGIGLPLLLLNFIPAVGSIVVTALQLALATTIVCLDFFDPPLSRRYVRFRTRLSLVARTIPASTGFGLVCLVLISIPFLNLVAIPICITAGTIFFCEHMWDSKIIDPHEPPPDEENERDGDDQTPPTPPDDEPAPQGEP